MSCLLNYLQNDRNMILHISYFYTMKNKMNYGKIQTSSNILIILFYDFMRSDIFFYDLMMTLSAKSHHVNKKCYLFTKIEFWSLCYVFYAFFYAPWIIFRVHETILLFRPPLVKCMYIPFWMLRYIQCLILFMIHERKK